MTAASELNFKFNLRHTLQREPPKAFTTTFIWKLIKGTQVILVPNGNNVKDITMGNPQCDHLNTLMISIW